MQQHRGSRQINCLEIKREVILKMLLMPVTARAKSRFHEMNAPTFPSKGSWVAILGIWGWIVAGCQLQPPSSGLKAGLLLPITGDLSSYGGSMQNAARLLIQQVNTCGGVLGQTVSLISEDDQTDPAVGAAAMTKLAEVDRVGAVVGAASSAVTSAALPIAVRNQVVQISPSSTSPQFSARSQAGEFQGFWFRTVPADTAQGTALATFAQQRQFQRVSVLAINNDYGVGLSQAFSSRFRQQGGTVLNNGQPFLFDPRATVFDSEVRQAFASDPDAVVLIAYPETGSLILKSAFELGLLGDIPVLGTDGLKDGQLARLVGQDRQGQYVVAGLQGTAPSPQGPGFAEFRDRFQAAYGTEPTIYDPNTWDAMALVTLAAEAAQSGTGTAIQAQIAPVANPPGQSVTDICQGLTLVRQGKDINYQGASGTVDLDGLGDVAGNYDIWEIQSDGRLQVIETLTMPNSTVPPN